MGAALTSLFGRDFVIAHCLPAAVLLILSSINLLVAGTATEFGVAVSALFASLTKDDVRDLLSESFFVWLLGGFLVTSWLVGLVLFSVNTQIFRFFEGYGNNSNPLGWFSLLEERRFRALDGYVKEFKKQALLDREAGKPARYDETYADAREALANKYPDEPYLLPTRFGNCVRAIEVYPREMYGLEGVTGWLRLVAVVPKDYMTFINSARAQVDLCLNMTLVLVLCLVQYIVLCIANHGNQLLAYPALWLPVVLIIWAWAALRSASTSAVLWGDWIRAAFDVYLSDLRLKLKFDDYKSAADERKKWEGFSEGVTYRSPKRLNHRADQPIIPDPPVFEYSLSKKIRRWLNR